MPSSSKRVKGNPLPAPTYFGVDAADTVANAAWPRISSIAGEAGKFDPKSKGLSPQAGGALLLGGDASALGLSIGIP